MPEFTKSPTGLLKDERGLGRDDGSFILWLKVGSDTLCRHNFEHNTMDGASSIMPA